MIFQIQSTVGKFVCSIKGTGKIKVRIDDDQEKIVSLPGKISIDKLDNEIHKIQINNINAENITIGPVIEGYITENESWGDLDIIRLHKIFDKNNNETIKLPNYNPKSLTNLSYLFYGTGTCHIEGIESW